MRTYCREYRRQGKNPFFIVPWSEDYLERTAGLVRAFVSEKQYAMQDIVLVFPNMRPKRYLTARYKAQAAKEHNALILPQMYANTEFYKLCLQHFERGLPLFSEQEALDRHAALYAIVREIVGKKAESHFSSSFGEETDSGLQLAKFLPWASSLDTLFEECFRQLVLPRSIRYADGEVSAFAQSLLEELEEIFGAYVRDMQENLRTTAGYTLFRTAKYIEAYRQFESGGSVDTGLLPFLQTQDLSAYFAEFMPFLLRGKCIIFAGFVQPSKAEECILRYFWEHGACISFYTDPQLARDPQKSHYSCEDHKKWLEAWGADTYLVPSAASSEPVISFLPAYDVHSQLAVLGEDIKPYLENLQDRDDYCAVVLPEPSLLMPVLHELPNKNINISLGYPLVRTLLWQFAEIIFSLQEHKKAEPQGGYAYAVNDILALLRHPYTKMLLGSAPEQDMSAAEETASAQFIRENFQAWRRLLHYAQQRVREKGLFVGLADFVTDELFDLDNEQLPYELSENAEQFADDFFARTVFAWENVGTLREMGARISELIDFLIRFGAGVWARFPLDKEGLARFLTNTVPALMQNGMAEQELSQKALFGIARELAAAERVPFEADPLTGLQVLGLLETRLLRFDNVFVLDCTERSLPGVQQQDKLMPDSLRTAFGLPDRQSRERIAAHTFYRLIHGAKNVYCYWQEGVQSSEIQSSKSIRSRFMEELIWEREKLCHVRKQDGQILRSVSCSPVAPERRRKLGIAVSAAVFQALQENLRYGLSAKGLNTYLQCPAKYYYAYLAKIRPPEMPEPGNNYLEFGSRLHGVLRRQYRENSRINHGRQEFAALMRDFHAQFSPQNWQECLAADSYFMLQESGPFYLDKYWREQAGKNIEVLALEHEFSSQLTHEAFSYPIKLVGYADRVDKRDGTYWIVDYKTTKKNKKPMTLWKDTDFLCRLAEINKNWDSEKAAACFDVLAEKVQDIQLPYYLYLFARDFLPQEGHLTRETKINASWIFLSEEKSPCEVALADEKFAGGEKNMWDLLYAVRETHMETVLNFILNHMAKEKIWQCRENKYCSSCPYAEYC